MIRRGGVSLIDDSTKDELPKYCPNCDTFGLRKPLSPRLDYNLSDAHLWSQCYHCGKIILTSNVRKEGLLTSDIEKVQFSDAKQITTIGQRKKKERGTLENERGIRNALDYIKDEELKKELRKGSKLLSYSES